MMPLLFFIVGLVIIIKGGDIFVDAAVWVAKVTGIPNLIIGATIVSLATTLPEFFVSTIASTKGCPDIAIGNAIGSVICNIGLILAISIIFMPGIVKVRSFIPKAILMIVAAVSVLIFSSDGSINAFEGLILISFLIYYVKQNLDDTKQAMIALNETATTAEDIRSYSKAKIEKGEVIIKVLMFTLGAILIVLGAKLLVSNAQIIAKYFNVPESIISLTIVSLGTSLPELVTAITSIIKKEEGVAVGNIVGANILNLTMILGSCGILTKGGLVVNKRDISVLGNTFSSISQTSLVDIPVALLLMLLITIPVLVNKKYKKTNGIAILLIYFIYVMFLYLTL